MTEPLLHIPVMATEAVAALAPADGSVQVDMTCGDGGYTRALLDAAQCIVWALDRDPAAAARAEKLAEQYPGRLHAVNTNFADAAAALRALGVQHVNGVAMDLGVSSPQLDDAQRGRLFLATMRMKAGELRRPGNLE